MLKIREHKDLGVNVPQEHLILRGQLKWQSSNGRDNLIKDLDSNHINNIINKIERGEFSEKKSEFKDLLKNELIYRLNIKHGS